MIPMLRHTTSFEDLGMENHGRSLIKKFAEVFEAKKEERSCKESKICKTTIEEGMLMSQMDYNIFETSEKNMLLSYFKTSSEANSILSFLINSVPQKFVPLAIKLFAIMIQQYKNEKVHVLPET